jgi:DNA-binding NarL/FixJ family response regulator
VVAAIQAGANGYVLKNAEADQITAAVHAIYGGQSALSPAITQKLMSHMAGTTPPEKLVEPLTDREREVLQLAASGLTNRGIGLQLKISDRTVQGHLASIYSKLQVGSRTEAVTRAIQLGLIQLPEHKE